MNITCCVYISADLLHFLCISVPIFPNVTKMWLLKEQIYAIQNHFQEDFKPSCSILISKNVCKIKPISKFVNLLLKTVLTGNGWQMISSTFLSISWQSLKITKICFLRRLDQIFCPACIATARKKNLISLLIANEYRWTFGLILKWRNVERQSNWMNAFFCMAFHMAL